MTQNQDAGATGRVSDERLDNLIIGFHIWGKTHSGAPDLDRDVFLALSELKEIRPSKPTPGATINFREEGEFGEGASMTYEKATEQDIGVSLLPCPFCGAYPHHGLMKVEHCQLHGDPFQRFRVWCPHGCAEKIGVTRGQAIAAWNRRTAKPATEWQGMDSAPKDGTEVVVSYWAWNSPGGSRIYKVGYFDDRSSKWREANAFNDDFDELYDPDLWMPLPSTPIQDTAK